MESVQAEETPEGGELYGGFVLLPEGMKMPDFVQSGREISICQIDSQNDVSFIGETLQFKDLAELKKQVNFPLYTLSNLPAEVQLIETSLTRYIQSGSVWGTALCWGFQNPETGIMEPKMSLRCQVQHSTPCPIWPVYLHEEAIYAEKIAIDSQFPGILLPSMSGYVFQWTQQDILYVLTVELSSDREVAGNIVASLIEI